MDESKENEAAAMKNRTAVERKSEREIVVTRTVNAPARLVFEAWTKPELFRSAQAAQARPQNGRGTRPMAVPERVRCARVPQ
jgi:hypothetical protein